MLTALHVEPGERRGGSHSMDKYRYAGATLALTFYGRNALAAASIPTTYRTSCAARRAEEPASRVVWTGQITLLMVRAL